MLFTAHTNTLTPEETELIDDAYANWQDTSKFSDEKVAQVKQVFARLFNAPHVVNLRGGPCNEAFVLKDNAMGKEMFYCLLKDVETNDWQCLVAARQCAGIASLVLDDPPPFWKVLDMMHQSEMYMLQRAAAQEEGSESSDELVEEE